MKQKTETLIVQRFRRLYSYEIYPTFLRKILEM